MRNLTVLFISLFISQLASADLFRSTVISMNTIYLDRDYNNNGTLSQDKITDTDFRLMRVEKHWAYGAIYSQSASDASDASRRSYGLSVGYYSERDFYLNYHYYFSTKYGFPGTEYTKGSGYEIDLGFLSKVTSSFYVGLVFAIKNFSYTEQQSGGSTTSVNVSQKEVMPMFTFAISLM
jgi:hypothetical protein